MNDEHRRNEVVLAVSAYRRELECINVKRLELARQEKEAFDELRNVLAADKPEELSAYFKKIAFALEHDD